jgi:S-adenosylmethionine:tRNA ribosyltransferase-isomerase
LPRYIIDHKDSEGNLDRPVTEDDTNDFQTVFAEIEGAVTAPSTGLHFTRQMMKRLDIHGIRTAFVTLHCGLGIFHPIEVEDLSKHKMDSEEMHVTEEACNTINTAKRNGSKICCVGASVLKATETVVGTDGYIKPYDGWTNKFIFPPYNYGLADSCLVNLYHPKSTMVMATAAFGGYDLVMDAYQQALKNGYNFGCFGDTMLIVND